MWFASYIGAKKSSTDCLIQGGPKLPVSWARLFSACGLRATKNAAAGHKWPEVQRLKQPALERCVFAILDVFIGDIFFYSIVLS